MHTLLTLIAVPEHDKFGSIQLNVTSSSPLSAYNEHYTL